MSEPDSKEFARHVLYNLAALTAEVRELKYLLCDVVAHVKNLPVEQIRGHYGQMVEAETAKLYDTFLKETKLDGFADGTSLDQGPGANPRV